MYACTSISIHVCIYLYERLLSCPDLSWYCMWILVERSPAAEAPSAPIRRNTTQDRRGQGRAHTRLLQNTLILSILPTEHMHAPTPSARCLIHMHVLVYACMYRCIYVYMHKFINMYLCMLSHLHVDICEMISCICICVWMRICMHAYVYICVRVYTYARMCMHVSLYQYMYASIYTSACFLALVCLDTAREYRSRDPRLPKLSRLESSGTRGRTEEAKATLICYYYKTICY